MSMDEAARHDLFEQLRAVIGEEAAATMMAQLPPFDWTEIATKSDLESLERRITATLRADFRAELNTAMTAQTRTVVYAALGGSIGSAVTVGTLVLAATQLA